MSEDIGAGVKILLERGKTDPDEIIEDFGKWSNLRDAVFDYKERNIRGAWLRGLTEQEIDALHKMFTDAFRGTFDAWVMKTVLNTEEEDSVMAQHKFIHQAAQKNLALNNPGMFQVAQPGAIQPYPTISNTTTTPSIVSRLKKELGIK